MFKRVRDSSSSFFVGSYVVMYDVFVLYVLCVVVVLIFKVIIKYMFLCCCSVCMM